MGPLPRSAVLTPAEIGRRAVRIWCAAGPGARAMAEAHPPEAAVPCVPVLQELDAEARDRVCSWRVRQDVVRHGTGTLAVGRAPDAAARAAARRSERRLRMLRWQGPGSRASAGSIAPRG
eukprot:10026635-Alexandrium_andersonii.AAC.1